MKRDDYYCLECGALFEKPRQYRESHGEEYSGCPKCAGSYVQAIECDACGSIVEEEYIRLWNGNDYCPDCFTWKNIEAG